nr:triggering receptor expressed on myeloid cells 1-like isoform X2 [Myodes glareolus]
MKVWCQQTSTERCKLLVSSLSTDTWRPKFSIRDYPGSHFFTVNMTALTVRDSGRYYCGFLDNLGIIGVLRRFHLVVSRDSSDASTSDIITTIHPIEVPTLIATKYLRRNRTMTPSAAAVSSDIITTIRPTEVPTLITKKYLRRDRTFTPFTAAVSSYIISTILPTEVPILITTKYLPRNRTMTPSITAVSSPDPGVTYTNVTNVPRVSISSIVVPVVCGLLNKTLIFTVLFVVTWRSFGGQTMKSHNSGL